MNRTTLAASLASFVLGLAVAWLAKVDAPPAAPAADAKLADLKAAAAALADEPINVMHDRLEALESLVEKQPAEL